MPDILVDGEVVLYGTVGDDLWGDGFTARDVMSALAQVGRGNDVIVRLNSGGGFAMEGAAIYNALANHPGHKTIYIDGVAASAASLVAMAGDQIVMRRGSLMMIHDPSSITFGTVKDHEKSIEALSAMATSFASIYAERSGRSVEEARSDMEEEIWLTPDEAVARGYAHAQIEQPAERATMFDYRLYTHTPEPVMVSSSTTKPPKSSTVRKNAPTGASAPRQEKEQTMATNQAGATAGQTPAAPAAPTMTAEEVAARVQEAIMASNARTQAILACDEAKGRTDLANHLAFSTSMSFDEAKVILSKAPAQVVVAQTGSSFERAMASMGNPPIGPDSGVGQNSDEYKPGDLARKMRAQLGLPPVQ